MTTWRVICGDVRERLADLPDQSVQCVVTSPPFWGLRDYGTATWDGGDPECDHQPDRAGGVAFSTLQGGKATTNHQQEGWKGRGCGKCGATRIDRQLGLEDSPDRYVAGLVGVFQGIRRVLRDDGTVFLNLGDSYAGGGRGNYGDGLSLGQGPKHTNGYQFTNHGCKPKDLVGIPWAVAFALRADGWYLRSDIIWSKSNPMPESVTDRCTKAHEYIFMLSKRERYYFDAEAIAERSIYGGEQLGIVRGQKRRADAMGVSPSGNERPGADADIAATRNKRSVWHVATQPYPEAHFATYPEALIEPCILAGTSEKGQCPACGDPWVRVVEAERLKPAAPSGNREIRRWDAETGASSVGGRRIAQTVGWQPSCVCNAGDPIPQTVLDPFTGSGTTGVVAIRHQRNFIGIELNSSYVQLARKRIGSVAPLLAEEVA